MNEQGRYYFGLTVNELFFLTAGAFIAAGAFSLFFPEQGLWVYCGLAFTVFVLGQMCLMAARVVILPELVAFVSCVQWIVAPWLSYLNPPEYFLYVMAVPQEQYFSYMVPSSVALWVGLHLLVRVWPGPRLPVMPRQHLSPPERRFWDGMIVFGFFMMLVAGHLPQGLKFFYYLLGQLRFVGVFALMFAGAPGWVYRAAFVYTTLLLDTSAGGIFFEFILWCGYLFISLAYVRKWRWKLLVFLMISFTAVVLLNNVKKEFRNQIYTRDMTKVEKVRLLGRLMMAQPMPMTSRSRAFHEEALGDRLVRYNQGWIIARVMKTVPSLEPYARGSTIVSGIKASLVPRVFYKSKITSGSREFFKKYTDLNLAPGTSMALGIAGEMYANFGKTGGITAMAVYGMLIGWLFSRFARLAKTNPIWWAWAPFVLLSAVEAEWNMVEILNNIVKSLMAMFLLIYFVPLLRRRMIAKP